MTNNEELNLFIIGPSGCGKSTQARLVVAEYGLIHLSSGELLRAEIKNKTDLGLAADKYISKGQLVPDPILMPMIKEKLASIGNGNFFMDGIPRTKSQAEELELYLQERGHEISAVIHMNVAFATIQKRRESAPDFQPSDRTDNGPDAIAARQLSYDKNIKEIIEYFRPRGKMFEVDGEQKIEPITQDIIAIIKNL